jgi:orotidine-5'-phosphate decarboxylase
MVMPAARDRMFVALDVPDVDTARRLVDQLGAEVTCYKVGLELLFGGGLQFIKHLKLINKTVFLDMKLLDIGATVEKATANITRLGVDYLTVHGTDTKTLAAAVRGRGDSPMKLLAVTVLTSLDQPDLIEQGVAGMEPRDLVVHRAKLAKAAGFDGVIASGQEAKLVRSVVGSGLGRGFSIVTPGIRLAGGDANDQARVVTPAMAIGDGASHLVIGRPITAARDPAAAARSMVAEIQVAMKLQAEATP